MGTFNFSLQQKVTTWMETEYEIEADNYEEAKKKAIEFHNQGNTSSIGWEETMDAQEPLTPEDNGGEPTEEIFDDEGNVIWHNTISK
jgi:hypothetical protein